MSRGSDTKSTKNSPGNGVGIQRRDLLLSGRLLLAALALMSGARGNPLGTGLSARNGHDTGTNEVTR
jgi:hypothetical protein